MKHSFVHVEVDFGATPTDAHDKKTWCQYVIRACLDLRSSQKKRAAISRLSTTSTDYSRASTFFVQL